MAYEQYIKVDGGKGWTNDQTKLSASNMNHMEDGLVAASSAILDASTTTATLTEEIETVSDNLSTFKTSTTTNFATVNASITATQQSIASLETSKQDKLVSGTNIKTINGNSILDGGDLEVVTDLSNYYNKTEVDELDSTVLTSAKAYTDEKVPTKVSELTNDAGYLTEHQSLAEYRKAADQDTIDAGKQAVINDLETIRTGAAAGATALQAVPDTYATKDDVASAVSTKQDTITDLAAIRSGAEKGATAVQPDTISEYAATKDYVDTEVSKKQDTISDLDTIRSGAAAGATALQSVPSEYITETELSEYHDSTKQDTITDLANIRTGAALGATALQSVPDTYRTAVEQDAIHDATKQDKLTAGTNITIDENNVISATGGGSTYTAGTGIDITENVISIKGDYHDNTKVDKVDGKQLSTEDFTTAEKNKLDAIDTSIYVEKVDGKGLSTNDYDNDAKTQVEKITTIETSITNLTNNKQDTLTAGTGISIAGTTISVNTDSDIQAKITESNKLSSTLIDGIDNYATAQSVSDLSTEVSDLSTEVDNKSTVTVSSSGTSTSTKISFITIDSKEYQIVGTGECPVDTNQKISIDGTTFDDNALINFKSSDTSLLTLAVDTTETAKPVVTITPDSDLATKTYITDQGFAKADSITTTSKEPENDYIVFKLRYNAFMATISASATAKADIETDALITNALPVSFTDAFDMPVLYTGSPIKSTKSAQISIMGYMHVEGTSMTYYGETLSANVKYSFFGSILL